MSVLEDLAEIAEQSAFGRGQGNLTPRGGCRPAAHGRCGSPDHMKGANIRIYAVKGKKTRTVCKLCDKARKSGKPRYGAENYPL